MIVEWFSPKPSPRLTWFGLTRGTIASMQRNQVRAIATVIGPSGPRGRGWTDGDYDPNTGKVSFNSNDGLGFETDDLRGADSTVAGPKGDGWTGASYSPATGKVTFASNDGLGFATGDLRGKDGEDGQDGQDGVGTGDMDASVYDPQGFETDIFAAIAGVSGDAITVSTTAPTPKENGEWFNPNTGRSYAAAPKAGGGYVWVEQGGFGADGLPGDDGSDGADGSSGIHVGPNPPSNPSVNDLWLQV